MTRVLLLAIGLLAMASILSAEASWHGIALPLDNQGAAGLATPVDLSASGTARRWLGPLGRSVHSFESIELGDGEGYCHIPHSLLRNDATGVTSTILGFRSARSLVHVAKGTLYARAFGPGLIDSAVVTLSAAADSSQDSYWFISFPIDSLWVRSINGDVKCRFESYWP